MLPAQDKMIRACKDVYWAVVEGDLQHLTPAALLDNFSGCTPKDTACALISLCIMGRWCAWL